MNALIIKLSATGDVVRTTPILRRLQGHVTWVTAPGNALLLNGIADELRCLTWAEREKARDRAYDLVINLEDEVETAEFAGSVKHARLFGASLGPGRATSYTQDARGWFDMSLISAFGRQRADELKFQNRRSYQELIFEGLGWKFAGEPYVLPKPAATDLRGDVALAPFAGPVWPMKSWAYYEELAATLRDEGLTVNVLPNRPSLLGHLGDVAGHRCLVSGDSLPMHLAMGLGVPCVTMFNCTSPWEIHGYGLQTKIVSPLIGEFFYQRGMDERATRAIPFDEVLNAVRAVLASSSINCIA